LGFLIFLFIKVRYFYKIFNTLPIFELSNYINVEHVLKKNHIGNTHELNTIYIYIIFSSVGIRLTNPPIITLLPETDNYVIQFFKRTRKVVDILLRARNLHPSYNSR